MKTIIKKYIKKFGYTPTIHELHNLHSKGLLILSDKDENELKKEFKKLKTKKVKIQQRSVYHKFTEVEIEVPNDVEQDDIMDWINDNEQLWADQMDTKYEESEYEFGCGVYDYDGMNESESDSEWRWRFQCPADGDGNSYGGHL